MVIVSSRDSASYTRGMANTTEYLWFLETLVCVRVSHREGGDRISVLEHAARRGDSPPLHVHVNEDEVFHVLEGEFRFQIEPRNGTAALAIPCSRRRGCATRIAWSRTPAARLTVTTRGEFEDFVRAMARHAVTHEVPPAEGPPSKEAIEALTGMAKRFGIEIVDPPLS